MVLNRTVVPPNATCGPTNNAQATDDHCHCMRWPLDTLRGICSEFLGAASNGGVTVDGRFYPGCEV